MLRAVRKFFALWKRARRAAGGAEARHLAWDRACRARGMTAREQADELQVRCAWVRLRQKASARVLRNPARWRLILDRVATGEARTLAAIGGEKLAAVFLRAYAAAEPLEILSLEAALLVRTESSGALAMIDDAPGVVPELARGKRKANAM